MVLGRDENYIYWDGLKSFSEDERELINLSLSLRMMWAQSTAHISCSPPKTAEAEHHTILFSSNHSSNKSPQPSWKWRKVLLITRTREDVIQYYFLIGEETAPNIQVLACWKNVERKMRTKSIRRKRSQMREFIQMFSPSMQRERTGGSRNNFGPGCPISPQNKSWTFLETSFTKDKNHNQGVFVF